MLVVTEDAAHLAGGCQIFLQHSIVFKKKFDLYLRHVTAITRSRFETAIRFSYKFSYLHA